MNTRVVRFAVSPVQAPGNVPTGTAHSFLKKEELEHLRASYEKRGASGDEYNLPGRSMLTNLQKLARYYRDVLTALAENSGRALRNLRVGRGYGLVADLSAYKLSMSDLLDSPTVSLERILPDLEADKQLFASEPEPGQEDSPHESSIITVSRFWPPAQYC